MFLHLGNDVSIRESEIISIHDYSIFQSGDNLKYLESMKKKNDIVLGDAMPKHVKSLIITKEKIYLSAISSMTLKRRMVRENGMVPKEL